jgi:branched-chain amino acid transport system permease protein
MPPAYVIVQQFINALSLGSVYALTAIGLAMVFSILRLINFAHGDILMVGAYVALGLSLAGLPFWLIVLGTLLATGLAGLLMERLAYRPLRGGPEVAMLLTSFAVTVFLQNLALMLVTPRSRAFPVPDLLRSTVALGPQLQIARIDIAVIATTLMLLVALTLFVTRTSLGIAMRAAANDLIGARLVGININQVIVTAFVIGSALAGLAGIIWGARVGKIDPLMGFNPVLKAFVGAVIGGFGSLPGAVLGGYILGMLEILLQAFLPSGLAAYRDALVFVVLIVMLLVRPNGLLGSTAPEKV